MSEEKIGFNSPSNDGQDNIPANKRKFKFSNQRKTKFDKASFAIFIIAIVFSAFIAIVSPIYISSDIFFIIYSVICWLAFALDGLSIGMCIYGISKGKKDHITYLIFSIIALLTVITFLSFFYIVWFNQPAN